MYGCLVWLIAVAICLPPLLGWNDLAQNYVYDAATATHRCELFETPSYVLYSAVGSFFAPFVLTLFLYVQIFVVLRRRMRKMREMGTRQQQQHQRIAAAQVGVVRILRKASIGDF